jgi:HD-GYP domain-containing protein (c-di-GMP phosphodiesterase class II)
MRLELIDEHTPEVPVVFKQRCAELGLVEWCVDINGMPVSDPACRGPVKLWLLSKSVRQEIIQCAEIWATMDKPKMIEATNGMRLYPFVVEHHGRRTGFSLMIAFTDDILKSDLLNDGFSGDPLTQASVRHKITGMIRPWDSMGEELDMLMSWMHKDLDGARHSDGMIESYADQLTESYETVTALHMLGRDMGMVAEPAVYIHQTLQMVAVTIGYVWASFLVNTEEGESLLEDKLHQYGEISFDEPSLRSEMQKLLQLEPIAVADKTAVYPAEGMFEELDPQVMIHPVQAYGHKYGWLVMGGKQGDDSYVSSHDTKTIDSIAGIFSAFLENTRLYEEERRAFVGTVRALSGAIDAKDRYTRGHSDRVAMLSEQLAISSGYSVEDAKRVRLCGILHDVGKIGVPEAVLCKNGRLTDEEFELIKLHPGLGADMLKDLPSLQDIIPGVMHHHERWDGRGYPHGLAGENIPELGRILALADTFDAMSSNRAYRAAMPREKVLAEIERCSGSQFEPRLAELFLKLDFAAYDEAVRDHAAQDIREVA